MIFAATRTPAVFHSADDGIAWEETLLTAGRPEVALWQAETAALVVPRAWARRDGFAEAATRAADAGWPVLTRASGGGAVPQGPGTLNLAMVAPLSSRTGPADCYDAICAAIAEPLAALDIPAQTGAVDGCFCDGAWNVTVGGRKLAGTAQRWRRRGGASVALIHAAILIDRPGAAFWPVLDTVERGAGTARSFQARPEAHVALNDVLPPAIAACDVTAAISQVAAQRLRDLSIQRFEDAA